MSGGNSLSGAQIHTPITTLPQSVDGIFSEEERAINTQVLEENQLWFRLKINTEFELVAFMEGVGDNSDLYHFFIEMISIKKIFLSGSWSKVQI